jgi:uncharacterized membrane protein (DUF4010 family)
VLPFLPDTAVTNLTSITPYQVWLAVLAVCTVSYASYLLQRYVAPREGALWTAVLGGLYSSTATTVVLARRARVSPGLAGQAQTGIVLANSIMYLRVLIIVAMFDRTLAAALAPALIGLAAFGLTLAVLWFWRASRGAKAQPAADGPANPLEIPAALVFAALFVAVSVAAGWVRAKFGEAGIYGLAAIVGVTDINPFVLSIASGGAGPLPVGASGAAILIAAASNNILQAAYTAGFAGMRTAIAPACGLALLALGGVGAASWMAGG